MKKKYYTFHTMGFGASQIGIEFGYEQLIQAYPNWQKKMELLKTEKMPETFEKEAKTLKYVNSIVKNCENVAKHTYEVAKTYFPVLIGGDHSLALGSIKGMLEHHANLGVIWIDAHGDMNTNLTTTTGNIHGMPLAALCGFGDYRLANVYTKTRLDKENIVLFATRDIDFEELLFIESQGIKNISYNEIVERGFDVCLKEALAYLAKKTNKLHISLDLDAITPNQIPGVTTDVTGGITTSQTNQIIENCFDQFDVTSVDIVEFNPFNDKQNQTVDYIHDLLMLLEDKA